jgi:DNA invertase Pin-like site-specific DNA recombinase
MKRCAVYARVSRKRDQSPTLQLDALRALCAQRRWQLTEYVDHGVSGTKASRPALDRLMRDVHAGKVDVVACWKFDRFARSMQHLVTALNDFRARGVEFVSVQDGIDTSTAAGRMVFGVIAALAEFERELIVERVQAGLAAAARRGRRGGRPKARVELGRARAMLAAGMTKQAVAAELGVGVATLLRHLAEPPKTSRRSPAQPAEVTAAE